MSKSDFLKDLVENPLSRRTFAKKLGAMSATLAGSAVLGGIGMSALSERAEGQTFSDVDILNFALNLEYLEAEYYSVSTFGATLVQAGVIPASATTGPTVGGHKIPNIGSAPIAYIASGVRFDEFNHVKFLRSALGSAAVPKPTINLAAKGIGFGSWGEFLALGSALEDNGLSAYLGAAPLIQNKTFLDASARIIGTEGQHLGALRTHAIDYGISVPTLDNIDVPATPNTPFFVDNMGLSKPRTFQQVLFIVYGNKNTPGGFFPNGLNGTIR